MFDFPASPANGQVYTTPTGVSYYWDATDSVWRLSGATMGSGSNLDADKLDGQDGSYYLDLANSTGSINATQHGNLAGGTLHAKATVASPGFFDEAPMDGLGYYRKNGVWSPPISGVTTDDSPPPAPLQDGQLWWNSADATLYVYYQDVDGYQWVQTNGGSAANPGGPTSNADTLDGFDSTYFATAASVTGKADKTYVDSQDALKADKTYVDSQDALKADKTYVDTQDAALTTAINGKIGEAPNDGQQYARQSLGWSVVTGGGGGGGTAASITFSPTGNISATNVQTAVAEVDNEKVGKAGDTMTGALVLPLGTAALPSLNFGTASAGVYAPAANQVGIATNGVNRVLFSTAITSTLGWRLPNGAANGPAYTFTADTTTGMYLASTQNLSVSANSIQIMNWSATLVTAYKPVVLPADPTTALQAATKQYVDGKIAGKITVGTTAPSSPAVNDLWVDTN